MRPTTIRWAFTILLILPSGEPEHSEAIDWPTWGGPERNLSTLESVKPSKVSSADGSILWRTRVGTGFSPVTTKDNRAFTMGNRRGIDTVYCFDAKTGERVWTHSYSCGLYKREHDGGPAAAVTLDEDCAYCLSRGGDVFCLDILSGKVEWSLKLPTVLGVGPPYYGFVATPLVLGESLYIDAGVMACFGKATGELVWKSEDYGCAYSAPIAFTLNGKLCIGAFNQTGVIVLEATDGEEVLKFDWKTEYDNNIAPLVFHQGSLFLSSGYNQGCARLMIDSKGMMRVAYRSQNMRNQFQGSVLQNGYLYGFDGDFQKNVFRCIRFETGEIVWTESGLSDGSVILADDDLLILSFEGELILGKADPKGFEELGRAHVLGGRCWTPPTLSNGLLYVRNSRGDLICINVRDE